MGKMWDEMARDELIDCLAAQAAQIQRLSNTVLEQGARIALLQERETRLENVNAQLHARFTEQMATARMNKGALRRQNKELRATVLRCKKLMKQLTTRFYLGDTELEEHTRLMGRVDQVLEQEPPKDVDL